jgi:hypothetical protein
MPETIVTSEREANSTSDQPVVPELRKPDVATFKEIVARHLRNWGASSVEGLCTDQTRGLIDELAEHYG